MGGPVLQDIAYVLATGYVGLSILLSGFFVRPSQLKIAPLLWLSYISYPRWAPVCRVPRADSVPRTIQQACQFNSHQSLLYLNTRLTGGCQRSVAATVVHQCAP